MNAGDAAIGGHVRLMRRLRNLPVDAVAAAAGMSGQRLTSIEEGRTPFDLALLETLAKALNTTPGRLLDGPVTARMLDLSKLPEEAAQALEAVHAAMTRTRTPPDAASI